MFYSHTLRKQIAQYEKLFNKVSFDEIYFGGGTPTMMSPSVWKDILALIPNFHKIPKKMAEIHPFSTSDGHIDFLNENNFSYVSMGVQSLSHEILRRQNRLAIEGHKIERICRLLEKNRVRSNVDLIFYLDPRRPNSLTQAGNDLDYILSRIRPASVVIHLNYKKPKTAYQYFRAIKLIKRTLREYSNYTCTNSLLKDTDARRDALYRAEYRIEKKGYSFDFYLMGKEPYLPIYGYNVLSLGQFKQVKTVSTFYYLSFNIYEENTFFYSSPGQFQKIEEMYKCAAKIKKSSGQNIGNAYNGFFFNKTGERKFETLKRLIDKYPIVIDNLR